jgi:hypothetical protein
MKKKVTAPKGGAAKVTPDILKRKTVNKKKAVKQPVISRQRETSVGSIATNLHEGSRSEYLAQYVFSSFGTAVPVPHQEDTGLDRTIRATSRSGAQRVTKTYYDASL